MYISYLCLLKVPRNSDILVVKKYLVPRSWFLNAALQLEEPGLLGEMDDSGARIKKIQDEPGTPYSAHKHSSVYIYAGMSKGHRTQNERSTNV